MAYSAAAASLALDSSFVLRLTISYSVKWFLVSADPLGKEYSSGAVL